MPISPILLENNIKLIHTEVNSPISHFGILINAGTRDEQPDKMGLAHFVEHTIFKGTRQRKGFQVIRRLEDVGGDLNASTSKEETYFHSSFLSQYYPRAVELLSDIFFNATFPEKEIEREKDVILEEINYYQDTPAELIFDEFEDLVFAQHPLGRNILGTKKSVKAIHREDILQFIANEYSLNHLVLASVGNISTKKLIALCNKYFAEHPIETHHHRRIPFTNYQPVEKRIKKNTCQSHALLGNIAYSMQDDRRHACMLLTNILGGPGMNTRLNMAIRERKGLAYSVEANYAPFSDTGLFSIYLGCDNSMLEKCIELTYKELDKLKDTTLGTMQLHYGKKQYIGQIALSYETKLNQMLSSGRTALFYEQINSIEESIAKIENISAMELTEIARDIFQQDQFSKLIYSKH